MSTDIEPISAEELSEFVRLGNRVIRGPASVRKTLQEMGLLLAPANFYSDIPLIKELETSFESKFAEGPYNSSTLFDAAKMIDFIDVIDKYADEFDPPSQGNIQMPEGYFWQNPAFSWSDAMAYYCILRHFRPKCVIEIGSGFSTLIALEALKRNGSGDIWCVEPYPFSWLSTLKGINLVRERVQDLDLDFFAQNLVHDNDVLFIDSTHTVKAAGDCLQIYLRILPVLRANIAVHAHDVYLPYPMPQNLAIDHQLYWTEQYLLYAYMLDNPKTSVLYGSAYHYHVNRNRLSAFMRGRNPPGGASLWFELLGRV